MADEASTIVFITELRKAQWYRELSQICHSVRVYVLMLILCASENQTLAKQQKI